MYNYRKLTNNEIKLIKIALDKNEKYIDDLVIYINVSFINFIFTCKCSNNNNIKSAYTIKNTILFSFDPNFNNEIDMIILLHEIKHIEQCKKYGYCCLIPRYLSEICKYGCKGMYKVKGTLEYEAEEFAVSNICKKNLIIDV